MSSIDQAFEQRRRLLLWISVVAISAFALGFVLRFGSLGLGKLLGLQWAYLAIALGAGLLLLKRQERAAALVIVLAGALAVAFNGWWVDLPLAEVPRTTHLYLVPLLLAARHWLSREERVLRTALSAALMTLLGLLAMLPNPFGQAQALPLAERQLLVWVVPVIAAALTALVVHVEKLDLHDQMRLELALAAALAEDALELHYQPQCDAAGRPFGVEALVRWRHPQLGPVSPASFVPLAERTGLILALGEQVARKACAFARACQARAELRELVVAINVSAAQFEDAAAFERLLAEVQQAALPPGVIKFELTESLVSRDPEGLRQRLARCRAAGVATALDDFGTGHASLASLDGLPFDQLKIDQAFVKNLGRHARAQALAHSVVQLGRRLGLEVVAEGVETEGQLQQLQAMGCERFQGYWFARPMPETECLDWLRARR